jgi:hypothetical protein
LQAFKIKDECLVNKQLKIFSGLSSSVWFYFFTFKESIATLSIMTLIMIGLNTTLNIIGLSMTLSIMTLTIAIFSIATLSFMTLTITIFSIVTLSIMTNRILKLKIMILSHIFSFSTIFVIMLSVAEDHNGQCHKAECRYAKNCNGECHNVECHTCQSC